MYGYSASSPFDRESLDLLRSDFVQLSKGRKRPQSLVRITKEVKQKKSVGKNCFENSFPLFEVQRFNFCAHETGFSQILYYACDVKKHPLKLVITWKNENSKPPIFQKLSL